MDTNEEKPSPQEKMADAADRMAQSLRDANAQVEKESAERMGRARDNIGANLACDWAKNVDPKTFTTEDGQRLVDTAFLFAEQVVSRMNLK